MLIFKQFRSYMYASKQKDPNPPAKKYFTYFDVVIYGMSHMIGAGIFVMPGVVLQDIPEMDYFLFIFAFTYMLIYKMINVYADIILRIRDENNVISYIYDCLGKYWAFGAGYCLIMQYTIAITFATKAWTLYLNSLMGNAIIPTVNNYIYNIYYTYILGTEVTVWDHHITFDVLAAILCLVCTTFLMLDWKKSFLMNVFSCIINLLVILCFILIGAYYYSTALKLNDHESQSHPEEVQFDIIRSILVCFYGCIGYDSIVIGSKKTKRSLTCRAIILATSVIHTILLSLYSTICIILAIYMPYWVDHKYTALLEIFSFLPWAKWLIGVGILCGIASSLFGSLSSFSKILYMVIKGLKFNGLDERKTKLSMILICSIVNISLALFCDLHTLMILATNYNLWLDIIITATVIAIRYQPEIKKINQLNIENGNSCDTSKSDELSSVEILEPRYSWMPYGNKATINKCITLYTGSCFVCCILNSKEFSIISHTTMLSKVFCLFFFTMSTISCLMIVVAYKPKSYKSLVLPESHVNLVLFLLLICISCNIVLSLSSHTSQKIIIAIVIMIPMGLFLFLMIVRDMCITISNLELFKVLVARIRSKYAELNWFHQKNDELCDQCKGKLEEKQRS